LLCGKKWDEYFFLYRLQDARAVICNPNNRPILGIKLAA